MRDMGVPGKATVDRKGYRAYIQSPQWRAKRDEYWRSKLPKICYVCSTPRRSGFHLHHRTYKNLGNERLMDLVPVCPTCHEGIHTHQRATGHDLWKSTKEFRKIYLRPKDRR